MTHRNPTIHTSLLFDPQQKAFLPNRSITVDPESGLITKVFHRENEDDINPVDIDLRHLALVLPGLIDAHTHIFLHPYSEASSTIQMRDESPIERTIRAVTHVRKALLAGYTTYRDLGTEAMADADVGVRDAINRGLIPGPRLFVATQAIASSGGYEVHGENSQTRMPAASDVADGVDGVRRVVRRRIGVGADVIKVYADYRRRVMRFPPPLTENGADVQFPPVCGVGISDMEARNPNYLQFSQEEMNALVDEAERADCPVAAHCVSNQAVIMAAKAGVLSIEHGKNVDEETLSVMKEHGCIFVPTLAVMELSLGGNKEKMAPILRSTKRAWELGVELACGGDTGTFAHGDNVRELELMVMAGVPLEDILRAATIGGWKACGGERCGRNFGWLGKGCAADIIGLDADPRCDSNALRKVAFVMKDGRIWKRDGEAVGMI